MIVTGMGMGATHWCPGYIRKVLVTDAFHCVDVEKSNFVFADTMECMAFWSVSGMRTCLRPQESELKTWATRWA